MIKRGLHIVLLWLLALLACGCVDELALQKGETDLTLTVRCDEPLMTRADEPVSKDGVKTFNENLILSVDFLFYPGASPAEETPAVYHIRKARSVKEAAETDYWDITLRMKKDLTEIIFPNGSGSQATVYALVNFDADFVGALSETSRAQLVQRRIVTDFAQTENNYIQPSFLMDGSTSITYDEESDPKVKADHNIEVKRFAAKLTMGIHVAPQVILNHQDKGDKTLPPETWEPVLRTMRLYLVDGVKSVLLSDDGRDPNPDYFNYKNDANKRPFLDNNGTPYLSTETVGDVEYYQTYPMYSYPRQWEKTLPDYSIYDYTQSKLPPEAPYFKLELDWRRGEDQNYTFEQRKYYYKVFIPFEEFKRNGWYGFYLDVAILGTETDEGKTVLEPSCFLLDWQNKSMAINKAAVISKARYISLEKSKWEINNLETLTIPFLSSHDVVVVGEYDPARKPRATRPFYGEIPSGQTVPYYNTDFRAWVRSDGNGGYLLDYTDQPENGGDPNYEPASWLRNTSTSIVLTHPLENRYDAAGVKNFDYSPYTIEFDIVHDDLEEYPSSITYQQYIRHITITQYPGIYIEGFYNSDDKIIKIGDRYGYSEADEYNWTNNPEKFPWGYVFINGGRFVRWDGAGSGSSKDPYWKLSNNDKPEYQWQAVWYTGGGREIFNIHVTVLPSTSTFLIGDPREDNVNNLDDSSAYPNLYEFTANGGDKDIDILEEIREGTQYPGGKRTGFNVADAIYDGPTRALTWYYPTERSSRTENMLSPGYRISTKLGGTEYGNLDRAHAEYRCAGYQEDGLPAGRWRIPTKAEINFVAQLSAKKYFEHIFTTGKGSSTYWSAHGAITVNADNGTVTPSTSTTALLRCVYDSWYWDEIDRREEKITGSDPRFNPRTTFYWGDKER